MKSLSILKAGAMLIIAFGLVSFSPNRTAPKKNDTQKDPVRIYSSPELFELVSGWADSYSATKMQTDVEVSILDKTASEIQKMPHSKFIIATDYEEKELCRNSPWRMLIGRDPVVPVTGSSNPDIQKIKLSGITSAECSEILSSGSKLKWGDLMDDNSARTIDVYIENEPSVLATLHLFTGTGENTLTNSRFNSHKELLSILNSNTGAVAFVRLSVILNSDRNAIDGNLVIIPFDINSNGSIDSFENIYGSSQALLRGAWLGKYPRGLVQNLYLLAETAPADENGIAFLNYLAVNGQKLLAGTGFASPVNAEIQSVLDKLRDPAIPYELVMVGSNGVVVIVIISIALLLLIIPALVLGIRQKSSAIRKSGVVVEGNIFTPEILLSPQGLLFDKSHTWTFMEKDGRVRMGIDDFLQHLTGPLTRINLLSHGEKVRKGEKIVTLSNKGKQIAVKSPVTGTISELNPELISHPSSVNSKPFSDGWIYLIEPDKWQQENSKMLMSSDYREWLNTEFTKLKDFLSRAVQSSQVRYSPAILNDGGEILDNALDLLGSEAWEDFQNQFID